MSDGGIEERIAWLEESVERIAARSNPPVELSARPGDGGLTFASDRDREPPLPTMVQDLIRAGRTIEAIKVHREQTGLGLAEAKDAVESARL